jgi:hypothetical protein
MSAATADPTRAKDAAPTIKHFNIGTLLLSVIAPANPMLVTGSIITIQIWSCELSFFLECCSKGTNPRIATTFIGAQIDRSEDAGEDAAGSTDVCAVAVAESVQHDSLFPGDSAKNKIRAADLAEKAGRRQRCLSDWPIALICNWAKLCPLLRNPRLALPASPSASSLP